MSLRRLIATTATMTAIAAVLLALAPGPSATWTALASPQHAVDLEGPDGLLLPLAGALAWLAWAWGAVGLAATVAAALPGAGGRIARAVQRVVLPEAGRRAAAVLIGVGVTFAGTGPAAVADGTGAGGDAPPVLDWAGPGVPDWPTAGHVVVPGDCLWTLAAGRLTTAGAPPAEDAEIATAVRSWWHRNADVIGPDPDLLLPGELLQPPEPP